MSRRWPLLRSAAVGGAASYAGKKVAGRQAPDEFQAEKQKHLGL